MKVNKTTISIPQELLERSKEHCWKEGHTLSGLIRSLLTKFFDSPQNAPRQ